jgi:hypothetical protein
MWVNGGCPLRRTAFLILILGFTMLASSPIVWWWGARREHRTGETPLVREFEGVEGEVIDFMLSDLGWSYRSSLGTDIRLWEAFQFLTEHKSIFRLASSAGVYVLPKRAFSESQLLELDHTIDRVLETESKNEFFSVRAQPSVVVPVSWWKGSQLGRVLAVAMALLGLVFLGDQLFHAGQPGSNGGGIALSVVVLGAGLWCAAYCPWADRKTGTTIADADIHVLPDALVIRSPFLKGVFRYSRLHGFREQMRTWVFYDAPNSSIVVPKQSFSADQQNQLRKIFQSVGLQEQ